MPQFETDIELVKIDEAAPSFALPGFDPLKDDETVVSLRALEGKWVVLFWYPADFTFVCPTELADLADKRAEFEALGVTILAASTDTVFTHRAWVRSERLLAGFPYTMLADHSGDIAYRYNLLAEDTGIAGRGTFIIDPKGIVRAIEVTSGSLGRNSDELLRKVEALQYLEDHPGTACPAKWQKGAKVLRPSIKIAGEVYEELHK